LGDRPNFAMRLGTKFTMRVELAAKSIAACRNPKRTLLVICTYAKFRPLPLDINLSFPVTAAESTSANMLGIDFFVADWRARA